MLHYRNYYIILFCLLFISCRKLIEVEPPSNEVPSESVYDDEAMADAAVADIYAGLSGYFSGNILSVINGMTADELNTLNIYHRRYVNNAILSDDALILSSWQQFYRLIYRANAVLEGVSAARKLPEEKAKQLQGEALFLRAFCYYYLLNCWGDVPLITTTDVEQTASAPRSGLAVVYDLVMSDLKTAASLLSAAYPGTEKVRANKWAAVAMLARVSLQTHNWQQAAEQATLVLNAGIYTPLIRPDSVFLRNSRPAILQIWTNEGYTLPGLTFIPVSAGNYSFYPFTDDLIAGFEDGDIRKAMWTGSFTYAGLLYHYPLKYKNRAAAISGREEYLMVLRIEEMYLIRAEALAQLENVTGALADVNVLRKRAGLPGLSILLKQDECLLAIEKERRIELFTEWGDRWLSLRRTNRIDTVLEVVKPVWKSTAALYPIPQEERNRNPKLTQNDGYQ